jgi:hypothetical protein
MSTKYSAALLYGYPVPEFLSKYHESVRTLIQSEYYSRTLWGDLGSAEHFKYTNILQGSITAEQQKQHSI